MARGVNKVILIGNTGSDPELRYLPDGKPVATLRLATTNGWTDKQSGQRQEQTEWHNVVLFGPMGENVVKFVRKGTRLYIEGRIQTRKVDGQNGTRYFTDIIANDFQVLADGIPASNAPAQGGQPPQQGYQAPPSGYPQQQAAQHDPDGYGPPGGYRGASGR